MSSIETLIIFLNEHRCLDCGGELDYSLRKGRFVCSKCGKEYTQRELRKGDEL